MDDSTETEVHNAEQAGFILSHPLWVGAFQGIEKDIFEQIALTNMHDTGSQQELIRSLKNLRRVKAALELHIERGIVARERLKEQERRPLLSRFL